MATWDRFDICEAYCVLEWDYNEGGILWERPSNRRRNESTGVQLHRMKFKAPVDLGFDALSENGKEIYFDAVLRWKLPIDDEQKAWLEKEYFKEYLQDARPDVFGPCLTVLRGVCQSCGRIYTFEEGWYGPCPAPDCPTNDGD